MILIEMAKNQPKVAKMAKQNENARFRQNGQKSAKIRQKSKLTCFIEFHANETWPES